MSEVQAPKTEKELFGTPGFAWRVGLSIAVVFGWLAFLIIWLFFYAGDYDVYQNIAVFLVSIIVGLGILAASWATWGIKYASKFSGGESSECSKPKEPWILSAVAGVGWLIFLIVWLYFYAADYNGYQNLAIFILSLLVLGAVMSSAWIVRWMRGWRTKG